MDLSHQSITGRQFELNRRGYDPDAVDAHLAQIAAAVAEREAQMADMQRNIESLAAKVQDADESEEALRLTLKAAAHAKEELLAGAREQAEQTQREAEEKATGLVAEAEENARTITADVEAKAAAMSAGASEQARSVAKAALAESELLVARIEELRSQVDVAEGALSALNADASPLLVSAREALDSALEHAKETAENPELLAAIEAVPVEPEVADSTSFGEAAEESIDDSMEEQPMAKEPMAEEPMAEQPMEQQQRSQPTEAAEQFPPAMPPAPPMPPSPPMPEARVAEVVEAVQAAQAAQPPVEAPVGADEAPAVHASADDEAPHLEVVEPSEVEEPAEPGQPAESTADISDKVDRLLEELREVT